MQHLHCHCLVKEERKYGWTCAVTTLMYQVCRHSLAFKRLTLKVFCVLPA